MVRSRVAIVGFDPDAHKLLLAGWLKRAHVRQWWGEPSGNLHEAVAPDPGLSQALIQAGDRPVGYLRWAPLSDADRRALKLGSVQGTIIDVDVLIGAPGSRNQGIASTALRRLIRKLTMDESVATVVMCPSVENHAAVHAFEKAGFVRLRRYQDPEWGLCWLMALDTEETGRMRVLPSRSESERDRRPEPARPEPARKRARRRGRPSGTSREES